MMCLENIKLTVSRSCSCLSVCLSAEHQTARGRDGREFRDPLVADRPPRRRKGSDRGDADAADEQEPFEL